MPIALGYIRRSFSRRGESTISPEKQRQGISERVQQSGWAVEWFEDIDGHRSGRSEAKRPEWQRLKERIASSRPGEIAADIVWAVDRSSRSARDFFNFLALLQERHVEFVSITQAQLDSTTPFGRAMLGLLVIWAALEADIDPQRATETITYKQEAGIYVGDVPYGYRREARVVELADGQRTTTGVLVEDAAAADVVREIFRLYAGGGYGRRKLAEQLNRLTGQDGEQLRFTVKKTNKANQAGAKIPFSDEHVRCVLENHWLYRGYVVIDEGTPNERRVKGVHPALIEDELAEKAVAVQRTRGTSQAGRRVTQTHVYILQPLRCALCDQELCGERKRGEPFYRHRKKHGCRAPRPLTTALEAEFLCPFANLRLSDDDVDELVALWQAEQAGDGWRPSADLPAMRAELERAKRLYMLGDLSESEYLRMRQAVAEAEAQARAAVKDATPRRLAEWLREFGAVIRSAEPQAQRQMIGALYERIETDGIKITRAVPRPWFAQCFSDLANILEKKRATPLELVKGCRQERSRGDSNPRSRP